MRLIIIKVFPKTDNQSWFQNKNQSQHESRAVHNFFHLGGGGAHCFQYRVYTILYVRVSYRILSRGGKIGW